MHVSELLAEGSRCPWYFTGSFSAWLYLLYVKPDHFLCDSPGLHLIVSVRLLTDLLQSHYERDFICLVLFFFNLPVLYLVSVLAACGFLKKAASSQKIPSWSCKSWCEGPPVDLASDPIPRAISAPTDAAFVG